MRSSRKSPTRPTKNKKFSKRNGTPRKQFFFSLEDDYFFYRKHTFFFAKECIKKIQHLSNVLEIGPENDQSEYQQFNTSIISKFCADNNISYKSLDQDETAKCNYTCSVEDLSLIKEKFDVVIMLEVLEHVQRLFEVPKQLCSIMNKGSLLCIHTPYLFKVHGPIPDCWRFSEYGYRALFDSLFEIERLYTYPDNELGKNSFPLCIGAIMRKK